MESTKSRKVLAAGAIAASFAYGGSATVLHAQEAAANAPGAVLEEIVVTGRRREELLQDVPISIQAFTGAELINRGVESGSDIGNLVPNLSIGANALAGNQTTDMTIRGVNNVGLYVDGIWTPPRGFLNSSILDIERLEVLRGPQGTLFGRNTNGGAIQLITPPPADEFGGRIDVTVGEYNRTDFRAVMDFPITDNLLSRFSVSSLNSDGWMESVAVGNLAYGGRSDHLYRADFLWTPRDNFSARITLHNYDSVYDAPRQVRFSMKNEPEGRTFPRLQTAYNIAMRNPDFGPYDFWTEPFPRPTRQFEINEWTPESHESGYPGGQVGRWENRDNSPLGSQTYDQEQYTLTLDWQINDTFHLRSLTAYRDQLMRDSANYYAVEVNPWQDTRLTWTTGWSEELQLTGVLMDGRADFLLGAYASDERLRNRGWRYGNTDFFILSDTPFDENGNIIFSEVQRNQPLIDFIQAWGVANGDSYIANFRPFLPSTNNFSDDTTQELAIFGEFTYNVSDRMELTAGVRVSTDDGEQRERQPIGALFKFYGPNYGGAQYGPGPLWEGPVTYRADRFGTGSQTTPSASVTYHFSDDVMMFFRYAEGFTRGEEVFVPEIPLTYTLDPEVVKSYELGLRSDWLDNTLRLNVTAYYGDWQGRRVGQFVDVAGGFDFVSITTSAGSATSQGIEIDTTWRPGDAWTLNFNVAYLDATYGELGQGGDILPDSRWAYAPEWSSAVGMEYGWPLGGGSLTLRGDVSYQSEFQWGDRITVQAKEDLPAYSLFNARLQYTPNDADWYVALFGTNLTDEFYIISGGSSTLYGLESFEPGRPRMLNMVFGMTF